MQKQLDKPELLIPKCAKEYLESLLTLSKEVMALEQRRTLYKKMQDCPEKEEVEKDLESRVKALAMKEIEARKLIDKVPESRYRAALQWRFVSAWDIGDIKRALGVSENRAYKIILEAVDAFDRILNPRIPKIYERKSGGPPRWKDR